MALRMIEMVLPEDIGQHVPDSLKDHPVVGVWHQPLVGEEVLIRVLVTAEDAEGVLDLFEQNYGSIEGFRAILIPVEASLPRPEPPEESPSEQTTAAADSGKVGKSQRISREELYVDVTDASRLSKVYVAMVMLSAIVATIGVLRNNVAVVIGAMVIAPLLGPNAALSLATTLGDTDLARTALKASGVGIGLAIILSALTGLIFEVDPSIQEIVSRTQVGLSDVALALAAGGAGALAFTAGVPAMLVGVMVAVAFLPPLVTFGLLMGSGFFHLAWGALLLFLTNLICINLSGVTCFLVQGISPRIWWEADKAKRAVRKAIVLLSFLLLALIALIIFSQRR